MTAEVVQLVELRVSSGDRRGLTGGWCDSSTPRKSGGCGFESHSPHFESEDNWGWMVERTKEPHAARRSTAQGDVAEW